MKTQLELDLFSIRQPPFVPIMDAGGNNAPPAVSFLFEATEAGLPKPDKVAYFGKLDLVPMPAFFSAYMSKSSGKLSFPIGQRGDVRALEVGTINWLAYSDEELVVASLESEEFFIRVCGFTRDWEVPKSAYFAKDGRLDLRLPGWKRIRAKVAQMRALWANRWQSKTGLRIVDSDGLVSRFCNGVLLGRYGRGLTAKDISFTSEKRVDGSFLREKADQLYYPVLGTFQMESTEFGKDLSARFEDELKATMQEPGPRTAAVHLVPKIELWMRKMGRRTLPSVLEPKAGEPGTLAGIDSIFGLVQERIYRLVRSFRSERYPGLYGLRDGDATGVLGGSVGRGEFRVFRTDKLVLVDGLDASRLRVLPAEFAKVFVGWCDQVRGVFQEFGSLGGVSHLGKLSPASRCFLELLGFRFTAQGYRFDLSSVWFKEEVVRLQQMIPRETVPGRALEVGRILMQDLVSMYMDAVGLKSQFKLVVEKDGTFGQRVCLAGDHKRFWAMVADRAGKQLAVTKAKENCYTAMKYEPVNWGEFGDRRSFVDRFFKAGFEASMPTFYPKVVPVALEEARGSWFCELRETWARGVVILEGSMRAYLKAGGFLLNESGGKEQAFWTEVLAASSGSLDKAPKWCWLALREAYLASYVWAWSQLLYSTWIPMDAGTVRRYRSALAAYSSMVGAYGRGLGADRSLLVKPHWAGRVVKAEGGDYDPGNCFQGLAFDRHVLSRGKLGLNPDVSVGFVYGGEVFDVGGFDALADAVPVVAPVTDADQGGPFFYAEKTGEWTFRKGEKGGHMMLGVRNPTMARAAQLVGLWFMAGQSRYAALSYGSLLSDWVYANGRSEEEKAKLAGGLPAWAPFGYLGCREWNSTVGVASLFTDERTDMEIDWSSTRGVPDFKDWVGLGSDGITRAWHFTEQAPLSFPMLRLDPGHLHSLPEGCSSILWMDRTLRAIGRGLDPVMGGPLNRVDHPGVSNAHRARLLNWRRRIWAPIIGPGGFAHPGEWGVMDTREPRYLCKAVSSLWRSWMAPWHPSDGSSNDGVRWVISS